MTRPPVSSASDSSARRRWIVIAAVLAVVVLSLVVAGFRLVTRQVATDEVILRQARQARAEGRIRAAEQLAASVVARNPRSGEAALEAAECAMSLNAWDRAVAHLQQTMPHTPAWQRDVALRLAELEHRKRNRLQAAERAYRRALEIEPDNVSANTGLSNLLCLCARRREAIPHILRLVRAGEEPELLMLLARSDGIINQPETLERARRADSTDPNPLVGLAWIALQEDRLKDAEQLLDEALSRQPHHVPTWILRGQMLLSAGRQPEFRKWLRDVPPGVDEFGEAWFLRGQMAEALGSPRSAVRCYWEAARRSPEVRGVLARLTRLLAELGETELVHPFSDALQRFLTLEQVQNRVLFPGGERRAEGIGELVDAYASAGRLWEAVGWLRLGNALNVIGPQGPARLESLLQRLVDQPLTLVAQSANPAVSVDLSGFPLPDFSSVTGNEEPPEIDSGGEISFREEAAVASLNFRYFNGVAETPSRRMFEFTGGGVAILDYDLDERPDVFFSQGRRWPRELPDDDHRDQLFHNRDGSRFANVSRLAGFDEDGFGQGVSVGDLNSDGFPDLYVANIGLNRLWLNRGDGTFADATVTAGLDGSEWTTSTVLVDLSGDGLPDVYDVNYVTDADVFERVCSHPDGSSGMCLPFDFQPQPDRFWLNRGDGRFVDSTATAFGESPLGMGLGVAAWDLDGTGRLSLFIANDTTPSFLFVPDSSATGPVHFSECGIERGVALNGDGKATGCMGVALGDVDGDGRVDLHITNFLAEPNTLFLESASGVFEDRSRAVGLHDPSMNMLGFGTQFLDADLDGRLELFVTNGHLDDLSRFGKPYRMPAQLYQWTGRRFRERSGASLGPYFERTWLGRAAARLDWNSDGKEDLVVGHLEDESALLTNTTPAPGRSFAVRLVGIASARDAIGTSVSVRVGTATWTHQLTAGDGYQASNERRLIFGIGTADRIDEVLVRWPSGTRQSFQHVAVPGSVILREGFPLLSTPPPGR